MSCILVKKMVEQAFMNMSGKRMHQEWLVQFNAIPCSAADAMVASYNGISIPPFGYTANAMTVTDINALRHPKNPYVFNVITDWSVVTGMVMTKPQGTGVKWRCDVAIDSIVYSEPVNVDAAGTEIRIWTKEPVDPPLEKEYYDERFRFTFRTDVVDDTNINLCRGAINSVQCSVTIKGRTRTFAIKTLKLIDVSEAIVYENDGTVAWQVTYTFVYRPDNWLRKVQPKSFHHYAGGVLVPNTLPSGIVLDTPQFLKANGTDWVHYGDALPTPMSFQIESAVDFTNLLHGITNIP